ncbi:sensor histidine kinase [Saccharibacillus alkalitolerans]|uniref:Sensor histidine kinase n=1 Tax=Saccharibacillus alkalitolerans TaxID=2705290 RepID=A0ABX0FC22_9BACL|nr:sensor histidine kinase [Saccharibacillus alkalitolerans]NGZ77024.1 sensor histidine kinase [Saccharibacillus alkalitolerans]
MPRTNLFTKTILILTLMWIPVALLYGYSNKTTTDVLKQELGESNRNQLGFFQNQVNTDIELLASWPNLLIHDPDIESFRKMYVNGGYFNLDEINLVKRIQNKLSIQESSSNWKSRLSLYSPSLGRVITENDARSYDPDALQQEIKPGWQVRRDRDGEEEIFRFSWFTVAPYGISDPAQNAETIVELEFDSRNIQNMLDKFKTDGRHDPFYYKPDTGVIHNRTSDRVLTGRLLEKLKASPLPDSDNLTVHLDGEPYMVSIALSKETDWYLIDYMPMADMLAPIRKSNLLFYSSILTLLVMGSVAAYLLYVQVQIPIRQLIRGFQRLEREDYAVRIKPRGRNEFSFLSERFNQMVGQIQNLFEHVYLEQLHVKEARLKQLQSQINPHFFYNCLSFVTSMAKLGRMDAVVAMSHSLSRYYRYTTRQERELVPLREETEFVQHYLEIQKMRMSRLDYVVELPEEMLDLYVPPLILQPLVENAVIHGIEPQAEAGMIRISGSYENGRAVLKVEDNGLGLDAAGRERLERRLAEPMSEETGCGLWNVNQRLHLRCGRGAGVHTAESTLGGLAVTLDWSEESEAPEDGETAARKRLV